MDGVVDNWGSTSKGMFKRHDEKYYSENIVNNLLYQRPKPIPFDWGIRRTWKLGMINDFNYGIQ
jgi:hypothetical protein